MNIKPGTRVIALKDIGAVRDGQPGIVTGTAMYPFFWWTRPAYLCTFFGNVAQAMKPDEISEHDHGRTLSQLQREIP